MLRPHKKAQVEGCYVGLANWDSQTRNWVEAHYQSMDRLIDYRWWMVMEEKRETLKKNTVITRMAQWLDGDAKWQRHTWECELFVFSPKHRHRSTQLMRRRKKVFFFIFSFLYFSSSKKKQASRQSMDRFSITLSIQLTHVIIIAHHGEKMYTTFDFWFNLVEHTQKINVKKFSLSLSRFLIFQVWRSCITGGCTSCNAGWAW